MSLNSPTSLGQAQILSALGQQLRERYEPVVNEPLPDRLGALSRSSNESRRNRRRVRPTISFLRPAALGLPCPEVSNAPPPEPLRRSAPPIPDGGSVARRVFWATLSQAQEGQDCDHDDDEADDVDEAVHEDS